MEAVLSIEDEQPKQARNPRRKRIEELSETTPTEEIHFPSVTNYEQSLFGDGMPMSNQDIDMAVEALAKARELEAREAQPQVQPGPGESELQTGWAIQQE
jgi:hypothetical protein